MNEREKVLEPVLREIIQLRDAYDQAPRDPRPSEQAFRRLHALLLDPRRAAVLEPHLRDARTESEIDELKEDPGGLIDFETSVSTKFGYEPKAALEHIRRANGRVQKRGTLVEIRSPAELVTELEDLHARARWGLGAAKSSPWRRPWDARKAAKTVDAGVYAIGSLVADALHVPAFSLSYTVAMALLSEVKEKIRLDRNQTTGGGTGAP